LAGDPYLRKKNYDYHPSDRVKFKEHIYKKNLVNLIMIFRKHNLEKHDAVLIQHDL
jgi:hypothetical protein